MRSLFLFIVFVCALGAASIGCDDGEGTGGSGGATLPAAAERSSGDSSKREHSKGSPCILQVMAVAAIRRSPDTMAADATSSSIALSTTSVTGSLTVTSTTSVPANDAAPRSGVSVNS